MGNASRQQADAFQPLGALQMNFQFFSFGQVDADHEHRFGIPRLIAHERPMALDNHRGLVAPEHRHFPAPLLPFQHLAAGFRPLVRTRGEEQKFDALSERFL